MLRPVCSCMLRAWSGRLYLCERKRAAGAVRWPAPAGSAKHWGWTESRLRCSSQALVSLVAAGGRRGGTPWHTHANRSTDLSSTLTQIDTRIIAKVLFSLCTAQKKREKNGKKWKHIIESWNYFSFTFISKKKQSRNTTGKVYTLKKCLTGFHNNKRAKLNSVSGYKYN